MEYVIFEGNGTFWSGSKWVSEYPDAWVYEDYREAEKVFSRLAPIFPNIDDLMLIESYGMEDERVLMFGGGDD